MSITILIFFAAILIVGALLYAMISLTKRGARRLDVDRYRAKWLEINQKLSRDNTSSYYMVVLEADKLLDKALRERGYKGETMGQRMKSAQSDWTNANHTWSAHKLRNRLAHEEITPSHDEVRQALAGFKQSLKDMGAI